MSIDILKRSTPGLASALALALTLGLGGAAGAQEFAMTKGDLESSLSNPDQVIQQLKEQRGVKAVTFVGIGDILPGEQDADQIQEKHRQGIEAFRQALREDDEMLQGVQQTLQDAEYSAEDVIAIHVGTPANPGGESDEPQRQETAAHQMVYIVVPGTLYPGTPGDQQGATPAEDPAQSDTAKSQPPEGDAPPQDSLPR